MERNKRIYFCVDVNSYIDRLGDLSVCYPYYNEVEKAIKKTVKSDCWACMAKDDCASVFFSLHKTLCDFAICLFILSP